MSEAPGWHQKSSSIRRWLHLSKKINTGTLDWFNHPCKRKNVMKILSAKLVSWDLFHVNNTNQTLKFRADRIWRVSQAFRFTLIQLQKYFIQGKVVFKCFPFRLFNFGCSSYRKPAQNASNISLAQLTHATQKKDFLGFALKGENRKSSRCATGSISARFLVFNGRVNVDSRSWILPNTKSSRLPYF